ncbi:hypothetical protein D3C80_1685610 [compost metagenome]
MDHGAIGQHGRLFPLAHDGGLAKRHGVATGRHLGHGIARPGLERLFVTPVEGTVVEALGLQEDDRVVVLDRGDQQAFGVIGIGRDDRLQSGDVGEDGFGALAVRLAAEDAAAIGRAHRDRGPELAVGAIAQARRLRHQLVEGR